MDALSDVVSVAHLTGGALRGGPAMSDLSPQSTPIRTLTNRTEALVIN
jgi:hypothetical protein